jgi:hypothetical protein
MKKVIFILPLLFATCSFFTPSQPTAKPPQVATEIFPTTQTLAMSAPNASGLCVDRQQRPMVSL